MEVRTAGEVTTVEIAATTIGTIPGIGTAEEVEVEVETAVRTITGRHGTITTGTRARIRAPEVEGEEEEDTTSGTTRTRTTAIAARRTGSAPAGTILRREVAAEIIAEATTITIVAATEALPADTTTAAAAPLRTTTNATAAAAADPEVAAEMTTIPRPVEPEAIALITAAAAEAGASEGTSPGTRWAHRGRWDRRGFPAGDPTLPALCAVPDRGRRWHRTAAA